MTRNAEDVDAQRQRILDRKTEAPALPGILYSAIVGLTFVDGYPKNVRALERLMVERYWSVGADEVEAIPLVLERDPSNEYDANAIRVRTEGGEMLGHLPRVSVAEAIAPEMDAGTAWRCELVGVRTHPVNPNLPGLDVRLTRITVTHPVYADPVEAVIAESVGDMAWCEVHFELATRDLPVPEGLPAMRAALIPVLIAERNAKIERERGQR